MTAPTFRTLDDVEYGKVEQVSPLIRRVIAENPSKFSYKGTGTYIVGHGDVVVIDPGPKLDSHREALAAALEGERVRSILVTHCHSDHSPLAEWLKAETGAPTIAFGPHPRPTETELSDCDDFEDDDDESKVDKDAEIKIEESTDHDFAPTETAADGDVVVDLDGLTMTAVHTPGHTSNHMCFSLAEESVLFTGDHVMGWSTTVVSPPDGDMAAYIESLRRVSGRGDRILWPTHGPSRDDGPVFVDALIAHRLSREAAILASVREGHCTTKEIVELLYVDVDKRLHKPARRSVWSHLVKLVIDGDVEVEGSARPALMSIYRPV